MTAPQMPPPQSAPKPRSKTRIALLGCGGVFVLLIMCGVLASLMGRPVANTAQAPAGAPNSAAVASATEAPAEPTAVPEPTAAPTAEALATIGQDVTVDEVRWKILSAEDLGDTLTSDNQYIDPKKTSGRFIRVQFEMENLSKDMLSFGGMDLVDNQNREFKSYSGSFGFVPDDQACVFENLNPNITKPCTVIYEVPGNAAGLKAKVGDLKLLGGAEAFIDLGF